MYNIWHQSNPIIHFNQSNPARWQCPINKFQHSFGTIQGWEGCGCWCIGRVGAGGEMTVNENNCDYKSIVFGTKYVVGWYLHCLLLYWDCLPALKTLTTADMYIDQNSILTKSMCCTPTLNETIGVLNDFFGIPSLLHKIKVMVACLLVSFAAYLSLERLHLHPYNKRFSLYKS